MPRRVPTGVAALLFVAVASLALAALAALATPGQQLWVSRYKGPANGNEVANALAVSPDGSKVFVTGEILPPVGSPGFGDFATVAYDASTGARLWVRRYNGAANREDRAVALAVSSDGSQVFVTGSSGSTSDSDYATVAYDSATGMQLWARRYDGPASGDDAATAVGVSRNGPNVLVTGFSKGSAAFDYATVAYNASTGARLWVRRYNGPASDDDIAHAVGLSPDGSTVFVTGSSHGQSGSFGDDYATVAYNASTGATLWVKRYDGPAHGIDESSGLAVSPGGGRVFVTGSSRGPTSGPDYATVAYNATTGAPLWVRRYNGPGKDDDLAVALGVSPDGSQVFVTGYSWGSTSSFDYATPAYKTSTGATLWVRRYDGPESGDDFAAALAVSSDGSRLFVTGGSPGSTTGQDFATLAYSIP